MKSPAKQVGSWILLALMTTGCTDRDRELAKRTGDGSDTFKYNAPDQAVPPAPKTDKTKAPVKDGSDTFHYKRDPRTFPKTGTQGK